MGNVYKSILKERIEHYGVSTLTADEALSVITGIPLLETKKYLDTYGLLELINFTDHMNLTKAQSKKLSLLYHLLKRISASTFKPKTSICSSTKAGQFCVNQLQFLKNEVFGVALLDAQNRLILFETIFHGTLTETQVYPREIVKLAINNNANAVILCHNHPGGSLSPSKCDIEATKKIVNALNTVSIDVTDHIIVAEGKYTSFAEKGLLPL